MSEIMERAVNRLSPRMREKYDAMPDGVKAWLERAFIRHAKASERCGIGADPLWMIETIDQYHEGRVTV